VPGRYNPSGGEIFNIGAVIVGGIGGVGKVGVPECPGNPPRIHRLKPLNDSDFGHFLLKNLNLKWFTPGSW
jgi:hypothetical protein